MHQPGVLGVKVNPQNGLLSITGIDAGSAAAVAGLQVNDLILAINGQTVSTFADLQGALQAAAAGNGQAEIRIRRDDADLSLRADLSGATEARAPLGVTVSEDNNQVTIASVASGSAAAAAGLMVHDTILTINGQPVSSHAQLVAQIQAALEADGRLTLHIRRDSVEHTIEAVLHRAGQEAGRMETAIDEVRGRLAELADQSKDEFKQRFQEAVAHADALKEDLKEKAGETAEAARQRIGQAHQKAAALKEHLAQLAETAQGEARAKLDQAQERLAFLSAELEARAAAMVEKTAETAAGARGRAETAIDEVRGRLAELADQSKDEFKQRFQEAVAHADALKEDLKEKAGETAEAGRQRIDQARQKAAALKEHLAQLAETAQGEARAKLDQAQERLAFLSEQLEPKKADSPGRGAMDAEPPLPIRR